jgi:hypothetical protein
MLKKGLCYRRIGESIKIGESIRIGESDRTRGIGSGSRNRIRIKESDHDREIGPEQPFVEIEGFPGLYPRSNVCALRAFLGP